MLAEGEDERLRTWVEKFDLERAVADGRSLPDELVQTRLADHTRSIEGGIDTVIGAGSFTIELNHEANRRPARGRPQHDV